MASNKKGPFARLFEPHEGKVINGEFHVSSTALAARLGITHEEMTRLIYENRRELERSAPLFSALVSTNEAEEDVGFNPLRLPGQIIAGVRRIGVAVLAESLCLSGASLARLIEEYRDELESYAPLILMADGRGSVEYQVTDEQAVLLAWSMTKTEE